MEATDYPFDVLSSARQRADDRWTERTLRQRPFVDFNASLEEGAKYFVPGDRLETAIHTAIAVGAPLLLTGEAGTGKTQAAYFTARRLRIEPVIHYQVKSTSTARDLLYRFDTVRYFHDANLDKSGELPRKHTYLEKGDLWRAMTERAPRVLLIDEIDKAPRDFPNDLLLELDQMRFKVPEVPELGEVAEEDRGLRPVVFITSNHERQLPEPFLRRCVYHHIKLDERLLSKAVAKRRHEFGRLNDDVLELALKRFLELRPPSLDLGKPPSTGEYLMWLRVLALRYASEDLAEQLEGELSDLPYLSLLIKNRHDLERIATRHPIR